jgi:hypothetical protein
VSLEISSCVIVIIVEYSLLLYFTDLLINIGNNIDNNNIGNNNIGNNNIGNNNIDNNK